MSITRVRGVRLVEYFLRCSPCLQSTCSVDAIENTLRMTERAPRSRRVEVGKKVSGDAQSGARIHLGLRM